MNGRDLRFFLSSSTALSISSCSDSVGIFVFRAFIKGKRNPPPGRLGCSAVQDAVLYRGPCTEVRRCYPRKVLQLSDKFPCRFRKACPISHSTIRIVDVVEEIQGDTRGAISPNCA